ncbi:MAG: hypothetical protein Q9187_008269, partial [Circinaria calcarea]
MAESEDEEQDITEFLHAQQPTDSSVDNEVRSLTKVHLSNLYLSHALSTWNARIYEFAAILFTASAFPDTLFASSVRLRTLLLTICANRFTVMAACLGWVFLVSDSSTAASPGAVGRVSNPSNLVMNRQLWLFAIVVLLGVCEKLSGIGNMISMERDWVPPLAMALSTGGVSPQQLTQLNAVMRRIDLICKLIAPVLISIIISATSMRTGVVTVAGMSGATWGIEIWCARRVWEGCPQLQQDKFHQPIEEIEMLDRSSPSTLETQTSKANVLRIWHSQSRQIRAYFSTNVWIPSLSLAILHLSVLSYSATFITYLLNTGFSLLLITIARTLSSVVEVSSTFIAPIGVDYLARSRKSSSQEEESAEELLPEGDLVEKRHGVGLERLGLWGISLQLLSLIPVVLAIAAISPSPSQPPSTLLSRVTPSQSSPLLSLLLFSTLCLSRLGLWTFDLTTQELTQTRVPPSGRSSFAGVEMSFVSLFELM